MSRIINMLRVNTYPIRTWAARRKHTKLRKQRQVYPVTNIALNEDRRSVTGTNYSADEDEDVKLLKTAELGRPTLPKGTKLITFPIGHSIPTTHSDPTSQTEGQSAAGGTNG